MQVSLQEFASWANANLDVTAALRHPEGEGAQLTDIKNTTTGVQRFFHASAFKGQVKEVRDDFQRAMTVRFGSSLAQEALTHIGNKPLTGRTIQAAIAYANTHTASFRSALALPADQMAPRLGDPNVTAAQITEAVRNPPLDVRLMNDALILLKAQSANVFGTFPTGEVELADMDAQCKYLKSELALLAQEFAKLTEAECPGAKETSQGCFDLIDRLDNHLGEMQRKNAAGALKEASVSRLRGVWHEAFKEACMTLMGNQKILENPDARKALEKLMDISADDFASKFKLSKDLGKDFAKIIASTVKKECGKEVLDRDAYKKALTEANISVLNHRAWPKINKTFVGALGGQDFKITSEITPGKHIGGVGETYPEGINGYMCHSAKEKKHAVNLAISTVTVERKDGTTEKAFTGVRHGVHSAWEIKDAAQRKAANVSRAEETVKAAFSAYLQNHPGLSESGVITLPMTSVSLLTPDALRNLAASITGKQTNNEARMLLDQTEAWEAIMEKGTMEIKMSVDGQEKTFRVKPQIAMFSFGVNGLSFGAIDKLAQSWEVSDILNGDAIKTMEKRVGDFVKGSAPPEKKAAAETLLRQLKEILDTKAERQDNHDGYKAAARAAVLTSIIDGVPCWNCKSGKDRTGELDVECKFLSTLIARGETIPEPGAQLTTEQKNLFRSIALQSGNLEMQEYNTGIAGFKTEKVDSIVERLGGAAGREFHAGGSKYVKF